METFSAAGKLVVGSLWVWGLLSTTAPDAPYAQVALSIFRALTLVHIVETILFIPAIRSMKKPLLPNMLLVFVFGVFHLWTLRAEVDAENAAESGGED